ncbi:MAG: 4-hydroxy-3-methylbut-2-enyl diphosphate reductase [Bacteroidetes bacterium]|nr:4-hydroxy-3-methylbut-2-enyl diphosphate reductase [Bacteroidota bacterium]
MRSFEVPPFYRSPLISAIKQQRKAADKLKKDFTPTVLDLGPLQIYLARHFGFCYGVENAIEIAFRTLEQHPNNRIFLLSEMIHNPLVNADLTSRGIRFLQDTKGKQLIPFETLRADDIVLIPAFGTTLEIESRLRAIGIQLESYNTTCPFVEKVWNRSESIAQKQYTIIIHGKPSHEETRATFSHAAVHGPALVIKDRSQAERLARYIRMEASQSEFEQEFENQYSAGFQIERDLKRIGVVNQTTMLASDTQGIADYLKEEVRKQYSDPDAIADTRDTLCYATSDNQSAVLGMLETPADLALVVGGYNSSNTSHLFELCAEKLPTYYIDGPDRIESRHRVHHFDFFEGVEKITEPFLSEKRPLRILITSGASCPDALVERILEKLAGFFDSSLPYDQWA